MHEYGGKVEGDQRMVEHLSDTESVLEELEEIDEHRNTHAFRSDVDTVRLSADKARIQKALPSAYSTVSGSSTSHTI